MRDRNLTGREVSGDVHAHQESGGGRARRAGGGRPARSAGIDYFRMAAAFMVIAIHIAPFADWSKEADFLLTYCLGRTAVPFFFMTTGYFVLAPYVKSGLQKKRTFYRFVLKNTAVYLAVTVLYLPLTIYSGNMPKGIGGLLQDLFFDGTFYHLWYFPAVLTGCMLLVLLTWTGQKVEAANWSKGHVNSGYRKKMAAVVLTGYVIGLLGDSYYGLTEQVPWMKAAYDGMFHISSYTRNGIFFAPVFLLLGVLTAFAKRLCPMRICVWGTALSTVLLMGEGFLTYSLKWQRHNSMYLFLVPLMYFLFQLLLLIPGKAPAFCRNGSLILYVIHPAVIVVLRGTAKAAGLKELLIDHAFIQYILVCAVSMAAAAVFAGVKINCLMKISR